jgi:hypothetical protein
MPGFKFIPMELIKNLGIHEFVEIRHIRKILMCSIYFQSFPDMYCKFNTVYENAKNKNYLIRAVKT